MLHKTLLAFVFLFQTSAHAADQLQRGREAIFKMGGCYLVDYSYAETESLKQGYVRDSRIYDVNRDKSIKEWIYPVEISQSKIRMQHILFATKLDGSLIEGTELKHQSEDWEYNPTFLYDFTSPLTWAVKDLKNTTGLWLRKITNLDDGLRYQCAASWNMTTAYPEWSCDNFAPIPGRETRDMGRKDYNTLQRSTRIVMYEGSWLERQTNIKTILENGLKTPLAKELGKNWYVRLPDAECKAAQVFAEPRRPFWDLLRETWDEVFVGDRPFIEKSIPNQSRYFAISEIEETYLSKDLTDDKIRAQAKAEILKAIATFRAN